MCACAVYGWMDGDLFSSIPHSISPFRLDSTRLDTGGGSHSDVDPNPTDIASYQHIRANIHLRQAKDTRITIALTRSDGSQSTATRSHHTATTELTDDTGYNFDRITIIVFFFFLLLLSSC